MSRSLFDFSQYSILVTGQNFCLSIIEFRLYFYFVINVKFFLQIFKKNQFIQKFKKILFKIFKFKFKKMNFNLKLPRRRP